MHPTAERLRSASACFMLIFSWLISTCWSSSLRNLSGGWRRMRLASGSVSPTVKATGSRPAELWVAVADTRLPSVLLLSGTLPGSPEISALAALTSFFVSFSL